MPEKSFAEDFQQLIYARIEHSGFDLYNNPKYKEASASASSLFQEIKEMLPLEGKRLMMELDSAQGTERVITVEYAYKDGLSDGAELRQIMSKPAGLKSIVGQKDMYC
jgi:hypothetical protein